MTQRVTLHLRLEQTKPGHYVSRLKSLSDTAWCVTQLCFFMVPLTCSQVLTISPLTLLKRNEFISNSNIVSSSPCSVAQYDQIHLRLVVVTLFGRSTYTRTHIIYFTLPLVSTIDWRRVPSTQKSLRMRARVERGEGRRLFFRAVHVDKLIKPTYASALWEWHI